MSAQPELKPVYLIAGSDRPKIERALRRLEARVGDAVEHLPAGASGTEAVAACNALGFFTGEGRLVVVDGVDRWKKTDVEAVIAYLADPAPATVLALVADEAKEIDPLAKACARVGQVLAFSVAKRDLGKWVGQQFRLAGASADSDACAALVHLVGEDLRALATEVDKLATWAGKEPVSAHDVEELVAATAETPTFALTDAWAQRKTGQALAASETIFEREAKPRRDTSPRLAAALGAHLGRLRQMRRLAAEGLSPREAAQRLKLHPFYGEKVYRQAEGFSDDELRDATLLLAELDLALKGASKLSPDLELQRTLIGLSSEPSRAERRRVESSRP